MLFVSQDPITYVRGAGTLEHKRAGRKSIVASRFATAGYLCCLKELFWEVVWLSSQDLRCATKQLQADSSANVCV